MIDHIFVQLSMVMAIAAGVALIARLLRQPLIIAYIITGFIVGPSLLDIIQNQETFKSFSHIGITLLLFVIGLGLNVATIKSTGKPAVISFLAFVVTVGVVGMIIALMFGFGRMESLILATSLLFSSTIIVVKYLSDKKTESRLYGRIAIGVLLVDDIVATIALLLISTTASSSGAAGEVAMLLAKGAGMVALLVGFGGYIMPRLSKLFASSQELLYLFAIAWAFGVAAISHTAGFSLEIGALFAGVSLASLPYVQAIRVKLMPLRDFFLILFFIGLGESLRIDNIQAAIMPALVLSVVMLIIKPLTLMGSLGLLLGYTKQTAFKAGVHLSQISEFSVIMVVLAYSTGLVSENVVTVITLTTLITIAISAYWMQYDDWLYRKLQKPLSIFERAETKKEIKSLRRYPLVLLGYHQGGSVFVKAFRAIRKPFIVVDYNPDVIETLSRRHINHLYGDATDLELLDEIGIRHSELVVSTIDDADTNVLLAEHITGSNDKAVFICHTSKMDDAERLYKAGATYVMMPSYIGKLHIGDFLQKHGGDKDSFVKYRDKHTVSLGATPVKS